MEIVAVDYSHKSSGLHDAAFSRALVLPAWDQIDMEILAADVAEAVSSEGSLWISGLDLEARWLSTRALGRRVLVSPPPAFQAIEKPSGSVAELLGVAVPPYALLSPGGAPEIDLVEDWGWPVWVKGQFYEATMANDWPELQKAAENTSETWGDHDVIVQAHVVGGEESIVFAADEGRLVGAAGMRKLQTTESGKTWAGRVARLGPGALAKLADFAARVAWHGAGEIEMIRTGEGRRYLIDVNPRFPAWVHGSTQGEFNLPHALVRAVAGPYELREPAQPARVTGFTRVITEIPITDIAFTDPAPVATRDRIGSKHPSGMPLLARRFTSRHSPRPDALPVGASLDRTLTAGLEELGTRDTPWPYFDMTGFETALDRVMEMAGRAGITPAFSIKTNPSRPVLKRAEGAGLLAEAITTAEVAVARACGWADERIILNGPAKQWPEAPAGTSLAVFFDSLAEIRAHDGEMPVSLYAGPRIRPPTVWSRFGIALHEPGVMTDLAGLLRQCPGELGIHMHVAQSVVGTNHWIDLAQATISFGAALAASVGRDLRMIDLGGGLTPRALDSAESIVARLRSSLTEKCPRCDLVVLEPGKALLAPHGFVYSKVLRVDDDSIVVDASIAELPDRVSLSRPVYTRRSGSWRRLAWGSGTVYGRSCMEGDEILSQVQVSHVREGDLVVFGNAGAYDASMRYHFATGSVVE